MSESARVMCSPSPVASRRRTAARIPVAAVSPVITSQAGNTWLTGASGRAGPVTIGNPTALFTV